MLFSTFWLDFLILEKSNAKNPANMYFFKVNNRNTRKRGENIQS